MTNLDVVLSELLGQRATAAGCWVDGVVDGDLAVFVVQPGVDILAALLQDLLAKNDGCRGGVGKEVVFRDCATGADGGTTVVSKMKDACLDTEPGRSQMICVGYREEGRETYQPR